MMEPIRKVGLFFLRQLPGALLFILNSTKNEGCRCPTLSSQASPRKRGTPLSYHPSACKKLATGAVPGSSRNHRIAPFRQPRPSARARLWP